jgi:hypothetical protein
MLFCKTGKFLDRKSYAVEREWLALGKTGALEYWSGGGMEC